LIFFLVSCAVSAASPDVVVGFLETGLPETGAENASPAKSTLYGRATFIKSKGEWKACSACPRSGKWTIAYDGKKRGEITTEPGPNAERQEMSVLGDTSAVPRIVTRREDFAGWNGAPWGRPLLLVREGLPGDPEKWSRAEPTPSEKESAIAAYLKKYPKVTNCKPDLVTVDKKFRMSVKNLPVHIAFRSVSGSLLIVLKPDGYGCDGPISDGWDAQTFYLEADKPAAFVGKGLAPLEAADVDGDGKSEWLFWYAGYNRDGYRLFYDGMKKHVVFDWGYH